MAARGDTTCDWSRETDGICGKVVVKRGARVLYDWGSDVT